MVSSLTLTIRARATEATISTIGAWVLFIKVCKIFWKRSLFDKIIGARVGVGTGTGPKMRAYRVEISKPEDIRLRAEHLIIGLLQ